MAREDLHFRLRIPEKLKEQVMQSALKNNRSMTAEINDILQKHFSDQPNVIRRLEVLEQKVATLMKGE